MITCLVTNWSVTIILAFLLALSEWMAENKKIKPNGVLDFIVLILKKIRNTQRGK
jgi:F0F1-type ATP synthase membrane subunit a